MDTKSSTSIVTLLTNAASDYNGWSQEKLATLVQYTNEEVGFRFFKSFHTFLGSSLKQYELQDGLERNKAIAHAAHRLRASAETVGFQHFADLSAELDTYFVQNQNFTAKNQTLSEWHKVGMEILKITDAIPGLNS